MNIFGKIIQKTTRRFGYEIVKLKHSNISNDMEAPFPDFYESCKPFTMTSKERMYAMHKAVEYIVRKGIRGDIVECGVWKGGSSMMAAVTLRHLNDMDKDIFMYDTYEGMPTPGAMDVSFDDEPARFGYEKHLRPDGISGWCYSALEEVKHNMSLTGYPLNQIHFVKGKVEDTIPATMPGKIALLRLDTDWYQSTLHELDHLYPRLSIGGILIIDDYGHWKGARKATDEYFAARNVTPFLSRIDYTGRLYIKCDHAES